MATGRSNASVNPDLVLHLSLDGHLERTRWLTRWWFANSKLPWKGGLRDIVKEREITVVFDARPPKRIR